ncbi:hypothetical protein EON79_16085 [bacterium]|nr:MAG: hypothetical protein EON79_16085 [bacterium]
MTKPSRILALSIFALCLGIGCSKGVEEAAPVARQAPPEKIQSARVDDAEETAQPVVPPAETKPAAGTEADWDAAVAKLKADGRSRVVLETEGTGAGKTQDFEVKTANGQQFFLWMAEKDGSSYSFVKADGASAETVPGKGLAGATPLSLAAGTYHIDTTSAGGRWKLAIFEGARSQ